MTDLATSARPVVTLDELAAYAVAGSSLVDAAVAASDGTEAAAVAAAIRSAEGYGARWLGYDADGLHVHARTDALFVMEPITVSPLAVPYAYAPARPVVALVALDGVAATGATASGDTVELPGAVPGAYVSADTFAGYRPTDADLGELQAVDALSTLAVLPPALPGPLISAVCESALAVLTRMETVGAIALQERSFNVSTQVASSARLVRDVMDQVWSTHARAYRILS